MMCETGRSRLSALRPILYCAQLIVLFRVIPLHSSLFIAGSARARASACGIGAFEIGADSTAMQE